MKRFALLLCLTATVLSGAFSTPTRAATDPDGPEAAIRRFYAWYVPTLDGGGDVFVKRRAELRRFVSARWLKEIDRARKGPDGLEADPFLNAQDYDASWAKQISVRNVQVKGQKATAAVTFAATHRIRVTLVREGEGWKLDGTALRAE